MKDPMEDLLRSLRPGKLPVDLRQRLAEPPRLPQDATWKWWTAIACSAASILLALGTWPTPAPFKPEFAESSSQQVLGARRVAVVDDGATRAWELVEIEVLEERTLVAANGASSMQTQIVSKQLVPVELHFD